MPVRTEVGGMSVSSKSLLEQVTFHFIEYNKNKHNITSIIKINQKH